MADDNDDLSGRILGGRYQLLRVIGRGGMGVVFEGMQLNIARRVAIKVFKGMGDDEETLARFRQEALLVASLTHPNVVQVTDLVVAADDDDNNNDDDDDDNDTHMVPAAIVMELLDRGETIATRLRRDGRFSSVEAVAAIGVQMLAGLSAAHAQNIVHRDIKPANVFLVPVVPIGSVDARANVIVKILDFGIAKSLDAGSYRTTTGVSLGTPAYMAPEQILAKPCDARTDLYATAACLFEMITGTRITGRVSGPEIARAVLTLEPNDIVRKASIEPAPVAAVIAKALARDPAMRFQTADAMAGALSAAIATPTLTELAKPPAKPPEEPSATSRGFFLALAATLVSVTVAIAIAWAALGASSSSSSSSAHPDVATTTAPSTTALDGGKTMSPEDDQAHLEEELVDASSSLRARSPRGASAATATRRREAGAPTVVATAQRGKSYAECTCRDVANRIDLSITKRKCYCFPRNTGSTLAYWGKALCQEPAKGGGNSASCARETLEPDPGEVSGYDKPCTGFVLSDAGVVPPAHADGVIMCFGNYHTRPAIHGDPCDGFQSDKERKGEWVCDPREE